MAKYPAFSVLGLEIEYMLVHKDTLDIAPVSDELIARLAGHIQNEVALDDITISNELVMHVIELKMPDPQSPLQDPGRQFQKAVRDLQPVLDAMHISLLPTGAHPWMNPDDETHCWPHDNAEIYNQYHRIFNCKGHGWANLQSMHVNLPFENDAEFFRLHNALRLFLPLIPALSASSPILDGNNTGMLDTRLYYYGINQQKIPALSGDIIPEFIHSEDEYRLKILNPMYAAIKPWDEEGVLQHEWLNSRAAIPKFSRDSLEIRIIDTQECNRTNIAIAYCLYTLLKNFTKHTDYFLEYPYPSMPLKTVYQTSLTQGLITEVDDAMLFAQWQLPFHGKKNLRQIWQALLENFCTDLDIDSQCIVENILARGNLSERILRACDGNFQRKHLTRIYRQLADCLLYNHFFEAS